MSEPYLVSGIQQIGVGVRDVEEAFRWYRKAFGMDIPIFDDRGEAPLMTRYTGGRVHSRRAVLATNLQGGSGFEIWQYTSRVPQPPVRPVQVADRGILAVRIKARDVHRAYESLGGLGAKLLGGVTLDPLGAPHFYLQDPWGGLFEVGAGEDWFAPGRHPTGGPCGCTIGVGDVEASLRLYRDVLGYDRVLHGSEGRFPDLEPLPGGSRAVRRLVLGHGPRCGAFSRWFGASRIELLQSLEGATQRVYEGRFWGDLGFMHLCFDVRGMEALKQRCEGCGFPFTVDSGEAFAMGEAAGRFAYVEDPDGTLIEFVETYRIPIARRLGLHLDLRRRDPAKPLPRWMLRALSLNRVRD